MFNCKHLRHRTVLARFSLATFLLQQWRGHGSFSSFAAAELDQWVLTPALRHPLSSSSYSFWMVLFINLASTLVVIGYTYRSNQKGNIRIRGKQFTEGAKMKYTTHYTTHINFYISLWKNIVTVYSELSEIMSVCVVWLDAADCNEYLCSDTLNGSIDISIPRRHSVPVDSLGCMAGNEQSEPELTTKCRQNFTIFTVGAKCSAKCSAGSWNTESPPKVNHKRVVWLAQYSTDP